MVQSMFRKFIIWLKCLLTSKTTKRHLALKHARKEDGTFNFRDDILDQLPEYFAYLRRLKRVDYESYVLLSQIGGQVVNPDDDVVPAGKFNTFDLNGGFGAAFGGKLGANRDNIEVRFVYFTRMARVRAGVEVCPKGDVYQVTAYFDDAAKLRGARHGQPCSFYANILPDGTFKLLKQRAASIKWARQFSGRDWCFPRWLGDYQRTPHEHAKWLFSLAYAGFKVGDSGFRINVSCDGVSALFSIPNKRSAYFFRDRDAEVSSGGKRKKIFHAVEQHERALPSGKVTTVKAHFRGLRKFDWHGYMVNITVPGLHHVANASIPIDVIDEETPTNLTTIPLEKAAQLVGDARRAA